LQRWGKLTVGLIFVFAIGFFGFAYRQATMRQDQIRSEQAQLKEGMTIEEVTAILGEPTWTAEAAVKDLYKLAHKDRFRYGAPYEQRETIQRRPGN